MRIVLSLISTSLLPTLSLNAQPLVIGFERFHAKEPSAAGGRLLYNELGCVNCHGGSTGLPARRGPNLSGVTQRIQSQWIREFLAAPSRAKPGTAMPHMLTSGDSVASDAVLHYLSDLKGGAVTELKNTTHVNAERGKELFHSIGCVACHAPSSDYQPTEGAPTPEDYTHPSVPFPDLAKKYSLSSLAGFLSNPLQTRPDGRMPRIVSEAGDALDLAGYLLKYEGSDGRSAPGISPAPHDKDKSAAGRDLVRAARCAACHELPSDVAATPVPLQKTTGGCLSSGSKPKGIPNYELSEQQQRSLEMFLKGGVPYTASADAPIATLQALNCVACHERDGLGGPDTARKAFFQGDHNLGDTGKFPPPLTGIGRKLQPEWFQKVLEGGGRVRPYLQTKMPVYGPATNGLVQALGKLDAKSEIKLPGGDDTAGRKLMGTLGGLGCITCHRWGDRPSLGIQALDLSNLGQRIQANWLVDYLIHPAGYRSATLMPSFWPEGKSANQEILAGDTLHQIASIYSFAKSDNGEPEGFPAASGSEFELIPKETPIVQRTFMEGVGAHAILVGFPQGFHVAYDGAQGRPLLAWRGKFFDAYSTWFSRFAPFEKPLGDSVVHWSNTPNQTSHFDGYRLDTKRVPEFLLSINGEQIIERFEGIEGGLRRTLTGTPEVLSKMSITHPEGVTVTEPAASQSNQKTFVYLWK
ncbi:MAG: hypothetical protein WCO60_04120 [Verrucomicrobiota bacterium]